MKKFILLAYVLFTANFARLSQNVVSSTYLTTYDLDYFINDLEITISQYGVDLYRVNYTTQNLEGALDTASGLICIPHLEGLTNDEMRAIEVALDALGRAFSIPDVTQMPTIEEKDAS